MGIPAAPFSRSEPVLRNCSKLSAPRNTAGALLEPTSLRPQNTIDVDVRRFYGPCGGAVTTPQKWTQCAGQAATLVTSCVSHAISVTGLRYFPFSRGTFDATRTRQSDLTPFSEPCL